MNAPNEEMRAQWNQRSGPSWVAMQPRLDAQLAPVSEAILARLPLRPGLRALDVGCGTGALGLDLARRVGPTGAVLGVDLSAPMLDLATQRAAAQGLLNTEWREADAQVAPLGEASFDLVASRFGVMFFDDPTAAFANLLRAARPGAALVFACWQAAALNPWVTVPLRAAKAVLGEVPMAPPGAPGPFAFGEGERVRAVLEGAGWREVSLTPWTHPLALGGGGTLDDAVEFLEQIGPTAGALRDASEAQRARVREALREALAPHDRGAGVTLDGAMWLVCARRAGAPADD